MWRIRGLSAGLSTCSLLCADRNLNLSLGSLLHTCTAPRAWGSPRREWWHSSQSGSPLDRPNLLGTIRFQKANLHKLSEETPQMRRNQTMLSFRSCDRRRWSLKKQQIYFLLLLNFSCTENPKTWHEIVGVTVATGRSCANERMNEQATGCVVSMCPPHTLCWKFSQSSWLLNPWFEPGHALCWKFSRSVM